MPERYEIRGQNLPDGNKSLSPKDVYNLNKNFETVGLEVFGNANFTKKIDKKVKDLEVKTDAIITTVADKADSSLLGNYSTKTQTADAITSAVSSKADKTALANYSLKTQTATEISNAVVNKAEKSEVTQLANSFTLEFDNLQTGGENLLTNSATMEDWEIFSGAQLDTANGWIYMLANGNEQYGKITKNVEGNTKYVFSVDVWTDAINTPSALSFFWRVEGNTTWNQYIYPLSTSTLKWERAELLIDLIGLAGGNLEIAIDCYYATSGRMWYRKPQLEVGTKASSWKANSNEASTTSFKFNKDSFEMKDLNGNVLIEVAKGIANEQNFGSTQNVQDGYPLNMSFKIGDATSLISSVTLRLKQYNFRTDSAGAASGGGSTSGASSSSTSGASSKTSTDERWTGQGLTGVTVSQTNGVVGNTHNHAIGLNQFGHNHGMAHTHGMNHTHSTPAHSHDIVYGIREWINDNGTIYIFIDDVYVTMITNTDIVVDVTPWVTTNGTHNIGLVSPNLKRIQCDVFIKSYIRR